MGTNLALPARITLFVLMVGIVPEGRAEAETYVCETVDKRAIVYSYQPVSLAEDKSNKICTFSVAGATTGQSTAPGTAAAFSCASVEKRAIVYAHEPVSMSEDKPSKICAFSIAGATSAQPPAHVRGRVATALPFFAAARQSRQAYQAVEIRAMADAVPHLLAAPGPTSDGTVHTALDEVLQKNREPLTRCLESFFEYRSSGPIKRGQDFGCGTRGADGVDAHILEIYARFKIYLNTLFLTRRPLQ